MKTAALEYKIGLNKQEEDQVEEPTTNPKKNKTGADDKGDGVNETQQSINRKARFGTISLDGLLAQRQASQ